MSKTTAKAGDIAAKAGASTGGPAAQVEAAATTTDAGKADVTAPEPPKPADNAPAKDEKPAENTQETAKQVADVVQKAADAVKTVITEAAKHEGTGDTRKIKVLRSHPEFAYHPGEEGELPAEKAEQLVTDGFAQFVSPDGKAIAPVGPSLAQLASAKSAYERFVAVAEAETDGQAELSPAFADLPRPMQCAFVAAVDPTYTHQVAE